ncbi:MAG TPA: hypothetical protein VK163_12705 [Opitutaceae bacterium]|nr:hypothetical protein [Opitutaceae bacterium]
MPEVCTTSPAARVVALRGASSAALVALALVLGGCATEPAVLSYVPTGDPVVDGNARLALAPPQDKPLWECRVALEALRRGNWDEARAKLDAAILAQGGIMGPSADAARARSLFRRENTKLFVGEPYERVLVYFYRAILYWMDSEPDNARACYLTAQLLDGSAEGESYRSDWVLPDFLDALASARLKMDWADALLRAQQNSRGSTLPPLDPTANVLVFLEFGRGPRKYAGGEYGEMLFFQPGSALARTAVLRVGEQTWRLGAQDDVSFQATTRGGRVMDHILANKAVFKETTDFVGDAALIGAGISAYQPRRHRDDGLTAGLAAVGLLSKIASAATTPDADTRYWDNVPQALGFAALKLPPGEHQGTIEFRAADGHPVAVRPLTITVKPAPADTVVVLSELSP